MKKIRNILLATALVLANSCSQTEVESTIQTALVDAEATMSTYGSMLEACPICGGTPLWQAASLVVATAVGAEASGAFGRQQNESYIHGKTVNINLPEANRLINNPFEEFGIKHNLALNYINSVPNFDLHQSKIKSYDKVEWVSILKVISPDKSTAEIEEIYNFAKDQNVIAKFNYSKYQSVKTIADFSNDLQNSNFSSPMKSKLQGIFNEIERLSHEQNVADLTINFLNSETNKILNAKGNYSLEETKVLVLLSTYKHSLFYWKK